jgi:ABC-type multidrug transport system fused ATPase/permease subunit
MVFFEKTSAGKLLNRFSGDTQAIDDGIPFNSNILYNNIFIILGSVIVIII